MGCTRGLSFLLLSVAALPSLVAQAAPGGPESNDTTAIAQKFVAERLQVWQSRLNLSDWKISVVLAPAADLRPETLGNVHWHLDQKIAVIRILAPSGYRLPVKQMLDDMEFTIVHELIHLQLAPLLSNTTRSNSSHFEEEQVADYMAGALLRLDRTR